MAWYKYQKFLESNSHANFDALREPSSSAPDAGVYRCTGCGREIGIAANHTLPPQNHHQHSQNQGPIRWQLIVAAHHEPH